MNKRGCQNSGFTLIELVVAIVVMSIGTLGFLTLIHNTATNSVDPHIRVQSDAIARAYLEEVMLSQFCEPNFDPDGDGLTECSSTTIGEGCTSSACSALAPNACGGANAAGGAEAGRSSFDDVCDYAAINSAVATDRNGSALGTIGDYTVTVTINDGVAANLNGLTGAGGQVVRVDVDVSHNSGVTTSLSSYKTNY
jgi:MSHA pilin protein MshD